MPVSKKIVFFICLMMLPTLQVYALSPSQVFEKVYDSVVVVMTFDKQGKAIKQGSGVLISTTRVATNYHVVKEGAFLQVRYGKQVFPATISSFDEKKDICILDINAIKATPAYMGRAANLKVGEPVYAIGAPKGLELSLSDGIVSQLRGAPPPMIQITAAISPGSSGGGLFDGEGRLVGLTTYNVIGGQSLNFALPVEWISEIKPGLKKAAEGYTRTEWIKHFTELEQKKDWNALLDWANKWSKSEPETSDSWYCLGLAYSKLDRNTEAIGPYQKALRINSEYFEAWNNLGVAYSKVNNKEDAIKAFRQTVRINPKDADAWYNLGVMYGELNNYKDAMESFQQVVRLNSGDAKAWNWIGKLYVLLGQNRDAIEPYRKALNINPEYAKAWYNLGEVYCLIGNKAAAEKVAQELKRVDSAAAYRLAKMINAMP